MNLANTRKYTAVHQYLICIAFIGSISLACYLSSAYIGYKTVALLLLLSVSIIAMLFDILPVLVSAVLSAVIWNFFFIPPILTLHISNTDDLLMFALYFFIALVNAVLTFKIRKEEKKARVQEEKEKTILLYNTLLNSLSHELRTPIATIIGAVDALKDNKDNLSTSHQNELLQQIGTAGTRLNQQVENLLNMSRIESGMLKPSLDWCDLTDLIHAVVQKIDPKPSQQIHINTAADFPLVKLDSGLTETALLNLLYNAILYTPPSATISIELLYTAPVCIISIADNGAGIPESELPKLFTKFYRLPQTKTGGSGLGLSIVKGLIEAQGGTVTAANQSSGGALFTITLPVEVSYLNNLKNE